MLQLQFLARSARSLTLACGLTLAALPVSAATYLVNWTGSNGYALGGVFSFSDVLLGTVIEEDGLDRLTFDVTFNGVSQRHGRPDRARRRRDFQLRQRDRAVSRGGLSTGSNGQLWNYRLAPVGFGSGAGFQVVAVGDSFTSSLGIIDVDDSMLVATRIDDPAAVIIPLPAGAILMLSALGAFGLVKERRRRQSAA